MDIFLINMGISVLVSSVVVMITSLWAVENKYNGLESEQELREKMRIDDQNFANGVAVFFFTFVVTTIILNLFN